VEFDSRRGDEIVAAGILIDEGRRSGFEAETVAEIEELDQQR